MKNIATILLITSLCFTAKSQEFEKQVSAAKSAYEAGKYEDSRFAVENALRELDIQIGKEVLKVLPEEINSLSYVPGNDNVTSTGTSYVGLYIDRTWGTTDQDHIEFSVISDSPLMGAVNTFLSLPMMMISSDSNQKKVKVEGYKALLEKKVDGETNKVTGYSLQLPYSNSLMTIEYTGEITEDAFMKVVAVIPVSKVTEITR